MAMHNDVTNHRRTTMSQYFTTTLRGFLGLLALLGTAACNATTGATALPDPAVDAPLAAGQGPQTAVLAGGCFWGVEGVFQHVKGVVDVTSGYSGGQASTAQYETVSTGRTGHAESVKITYDPSRISYGQLLKVYFSVAHDPTELNRQGPDEGTQYRSAIFYANAEQARIARDYIDQLQRAHAFRQTHRDAGRCPESLLSCRGLPSGLPDSSPRESLYRYQRSAQDRPSAPGASQPVCSGQVATRIAHRAGQTSAASARGQMMQAPSCSATSANLRGLFLRHDLLLGHNESWLKASTLCRQPAQTARR